MVLLLFAEIANQTEPGGIVLPVSIKHFASCAAHALPTHSAYRCSSSILSRVSAVLMVEKQPNVTDFQAKFTIFSELPTEAL